jgi:toxin ParE1/3/4
VKVALHAGAERDLEEAAAFYEREGSGLLASRFIAEFKRLSTVLSANPEIGSPRSNGRRGFAMSVFPYTVIYRVDPTEVLVLVVKHDHRRPGFGGKRA